MLPDHCDLSEPPASPPPEPPSEPSPCGVGIVAQPPKPPPALVIVEKT